MSRRPFCFPRRTENVLISSINRNPHGRNPRSFSTSSLVTLSPINLSLSIRTPSISRQMFIDSIPELTLSSIDPILLYVKQLYTIGLDLSVIAESIFKNEYLSDVDTTFTDSILTLSKQVNLSPIEMAFSVIGPTLAGAGATDAINLILGTENLNVSKTVYLQAEEMIFSQIDTTLVSAIPGIDLYLDTIDLSLSLQTLLSSRNVVSSLLENISLTNSIQINKNVYLSSIDILLEGSDPYDFLNDTTIEPIDLSLSTSIFAYKTVNASTNTITLNTSILADKAFNAGSNDLTLSVTSLVINKTINLAVESIVFESNEPL